MRIGVFGGSFDPVHRGHLLLAECCLRQASLDRVVFVPAAHQPHKPRAPRASEADRLSMLRLAIAAHPAFDVSTIEFERGGYSYTVDTLRTLAEQERGAELFFLMGADALADLPHWREPAAICELASPVVVHRAGWPEPDIGALAAFLPPERIAELCQLMVEMPATLISSSAIQRAIAEGGQWQDLVPSEVAAYIDEHGLYRSAAS